MLQLDRCRLSAPLKANLVLDLKFESESELERAVDENEEK